MRQGERVEMKLELVLLPVADVDRSKAFGATLGKALQPLSSGTALLPVLVACQ